MNDKKRVFYGYDKCSTCRDAEKTLRERGVAFEKVALVEAPPSAATFARWMKASPLPTKRWVNSSGLSYRAMLAERGKDAVDALTPGDWAALFAKDGKLVKRPLLVDGDRVIVGFDREAYAAMTP